MTQQTGNLSDTERVWSTLLGVGASLLAVRRGSPWLRSLGAAAAVGLLSRAFAGHCGIKSAICGTTSLRDGLREQWSQMSRGATAGGAGGGARPGSAAHAAQSDAVDESIAQSFPASDPPASHLPDEPPVNAQAKWEAARTGQPTEPT
jgi:hypothetical protein